MNTLVWAGYASIFLSSVIANQTEPKYDTIFGHRINNKISSKESPQSKERRYFFRKKYLDEVRQFKPDLHKYKDDLTYSEQLARRPLEPQSCRREYVNSPNYTRKSVLPEYLMCDSQFKQYGEDIEKEALASLERRFAREKKEREEKEARERMSTVHHKRMSTVHPMFRTRKTFPTSTTESSHEIFTASSRILHELEAEQNKMYTGDSAHYEQLYEEAYKDVNSSESKSISSDYSSFERWYDERMKYPNRTTPHYEWWTYNPNDTVETFEGKPVDINRALYSLKMSSILPANISAEVDHYDNPGILDTKEANEIRASMDEWARTIGDEYNSNCGPIPERRELREPFEIMQNRYYDVEDKFGRNLKEDVNKYFIKPAKKGLYHFKHWLNRNFTTTTRKIALTWPEQSLNSEQMVQHYKKYLREERNMTVRDSAGRSIFKKEQYDFTEASNYYDESRGDFPWATIHPY